MIDLILSGATVHSENGVMNNAAIAIHDGKIITIAEHISTSARQIVNLPPGSQLLPGMIDLHIHGSSGVDVMDATPEALATLCESLPKQGTTGFLATTMTMSSVAIESALKNIAEFVANDNYVGARLLGVHLEGPFISKEKLGAHRQEYVLPLDIELVKQWQALSGGMIKLVTLAPELAGATEFITALRDMGIVPSIGHTNATMKETRSAIHAGCCHATHLYNAMSGVHHRNPGAAAAILESNEVLAELIVDGHHVCSEMVESTYAIKGEQSLCLVTDAMRAQCLGNGEFDLGGQVVTVSNGKAMLNSNTLAGSVVTMEQAMKNFRQYTGCDLNTVIQLTSTNPAKQLNCFDRKGSIQVGKDADLVVFNENNELMMSVCEGAIVFGSDIMPG